MRNRYAPSRDGQKFLLLPDQDDKTAVLGFDVIVNWPRLVEQK